VSGNFDKEMVGGYNGGIGVWSAIVWSSGTILVCGWPNHYRNEEGTGMVDDAPRLLVLLTPLHATCYG